MTPLKSKALQRGDRISVVAPAGPVNRERLERALERLRQRGFFPKTYGEIDRSDGYLAGDDVTRADELMTAFADPDTTVVWCARGGYGAARILERIDFDLIHRHPKVFIGFSDITALHIPIHQRTGLITFHGPNLQDGFGKTDDIRGANEASLWRAVFAEKQHNAPIGYELDGSDEERGTLWTIRTGRAKGRLTGGNLSVLAGTIGTPFEIETAGRILFLEDVGERPYRLDRYLVQLSLAGKLHAAAGVLLGSFTQDEQPAERAESVDKLLSEYFSRLDVPVLAGFPAGHTRTNLTLPIGALLEIDAGDKRVAVCENAVEAGSS